ncbi:APC family permease [Robiginitomaculum antarcticum]|uniref:APC family permease n=1 Tax=Robiginitomaculum antarcticum TaxID=437507 RepID=UPI00052576B3
MNKDSYKAGSLSLSGAVAMGTGVMIGAGIFALTGQIAELAGPSFPIAFLVAAFISGFSAYSYVKVSNKYPSSGGIAMILKKAYGPSVITGAASLLMVFSMIINESLVARTFASYSLQLFDVKNTALLVPALALGLIFLAFLVNIAGNKFIGGISKLTAILKIGGILVFAFIILWGSGLSSASGVQAGGDTTVTPMSFIAGMALAILAFKGFTTITNSGGEITNPKKNVGRAIIISLAICLIVYLAVALAVGSALDIDAIIAAKDFSLAEAARPTLGQTGVIFTVIIAIIATSSGLLASVFAVSRMLTMLTKMKLIPHRHFGLPGGLQTHLLIYTVVMAGLLAAFFDLTRIASLGAIFYLLMDIVIHWGVFKYLRDDVGARPTILILAIIFDAIALTAFIIMKAMNDPLILGIAAVGLVGIYVLESYYLKKMREVGIGLETTHMDSHS